MDDNSRKRPLSLQWLSENSERAGQKPRVESIDAGNTMSNFAGQGIQHTGQGDFNVRGNVNITTNNAAPTSTAEEDCLRDLFITDPSEDRNALKRKKGNRAAGTCEWILETDELTVWLDQGQTSNILWLYGNPGTGKSTTAIFLTEKLSTLFSTPEGKTLAYFFCDSSFDTRKTATSVIRGLLLQLVQQHRQLLAYIVPKHNERGAGLFKSFDALWTIFMAAAADQKTGRKYCVIDALDECDRESQKILLQQFQETFQGQDAPSNIRILVTSRPYPEIGEYLDEFANKDLASFPQTNEDIDRCIEERVADLVKKKRYTDKVKHQVSNILRDKAEGTFLWVGLACEELKEIPSKDAVKILQSMPKGLHSLYKTLLETAQEESEADIIRSILSLVAVCMQPLNVLELSEACQLFEEEEDMETRVQYTRDQIASCRLMIIIQDEKVLLLHQSVKDFLVGSSPDYFINELEVHANIVHRCIHLLMEEFNGREQSSMHFFSYAIKRWPDHARMAQSRFEVRDSEAHFFQPISRSREHWLRTLHDHLDSSRDYSYWQFLGHDYSDIPRQMSILHIAARWGIASLVDYSTNQHCEESTTKTKMSFVNLDYIDSDNRTPIELAVKRGFIIVISKFLDLGAVVNEAVVATSAENWRNGEKVMAMLFDQREDQITITEGIVRAAAGNSNKEVMALLFDRRDHQITITEEIVKAAAGNSNKEVMALLFDRRENQITITEEIVKAAAGNYNKEVMALLLDRRGDQITITEAIIKAATRNHGSEVMALLFDRRGSQIKITKDIVKAAARNSTKEVISLLLDYRGSEITITEEVVMAAAENHNQGSMILLLDRRGNDISITEEVIKVLAKNFSCAKEVIAFLLDQRKDHIFFTEDIVRNLAVHFDKETMILFFEKCRDKVSITEDIVSFIASYFDADIMAFLLDQWGNEITITEKILKNAAENMWIGEEMMSLLFDRRAYEIVITEEVLKSAAENRGDSKVMGFLLSQQGDKITITEEVVKAAARNWDMGAEVMALLLDWQGGQIAITENIILAAARNQEKGKEIMTLLLDRRGNEITITEKVMSAIAQVSDKKMMELLLSQRVNAITIKETALIAAAENWYHGREVILLLLRQGGSNIAITEKILRAAARNIKSGKEIMLLLLSQRDYRVTITEEVVKSAAGNSMEVMEFLLNHRGTEIAITEDVLKAATGHHTDTKVITLLLKQQEHKISITEDVVKTAAKNTRCAEEMIALLLNQQGHQITITEQVVMAAAGNNFRGKEVMKLLLDRRGHQVTITEEVVKAAAGNYFNGKKIMKLLLDQRGHQVTITEEVIKAAAGHKSSRKMMKLLLDQRGHQVAITEEVIKAAAGNPFNGKEVILLLLQERGHQVTITEEVVKAAAGNYLSGKKVMELLLNQRGHQVTITEEVVKAAAGNERCGKSLMILLLNQRRDQITITENVVRTAAACGQDDVLDLLSKDKSIVTDWDKWRCISKFYHAAKTGNVHCIKQLLNQGVEPDTKNLLGETPLWIAAKYEQTSVLQLLAQEKNVDVNSLSNSSTSLLFWVSQEGYEGYVDILMKAGADPYLVNKDGHTAITIAKKHGYSRIVKMLERVG